MTSYKVGLTGLIGSGKSLAANYFSSLGINIVDTDVISHDITNKNGIAIPQINKVFGPSYLTTNGALDRNKMRDLIFNDKLKKQQLESILHPLIFEEVALQVLQSKSIYTIIVIPLLFSSSRYVKYIDRSIFVDCKEEIIVSRVMKRNGWKQETVLAILNNQMPRIEQLARADDVLINNQMPQDLESQIKKLHSKYENIINDYFSARK